MRIALGVIILAVLPGFAADETAAMYGVYNEASIIGVVRIAPGSNMLIFSGVLPIGPDAPATASEDSLGPNLGGTSVRVTVGDVSVDAYVLGTERNYVRAMLPAGTPLGEGRLVVTYNGRTSAPYAIHVVKRQFAIYDGSWCRPSSFPRIPGFCIPRSVGNAGAGGEYIGNSLLAPARPGQLVTLRGTGLGDARDDVRVFVGGIAAEVVESGPANCCAGVDEVTFVVPRAIEGCNVPVWVQYDESSWTGDVFVAIASGEEACSDAQGLTSPDIRKLASGDLKAAQLSIRGEYWYAAFGTAVSTSTIPPGTCQASQWSSNSAVDLAPAFQDVGRMLILQTPSRTLSATRTESGFYTAAFEEKPEPGGYALDNNGGNASTLPFRTQFSVPSSNPEWTNPDSFPSASLSDGATVTWTGVDAPEYQILVAGTFADDGEISGGFLCQERANKGTFTIPAVVLRRAGLDNPHWNEMRITVIARFAQRLSIPGFDYTEFSYFDSLGTKTVVLR